MSEGECRVDLRQTGPQVRRGVAVTPAPPWLPKAVNELARNRSGWSNRFKAKGAPTIRITKSER